MIEQIVQFFGEIAPFVEYILNTLSYPVVLHHHQKNNIMNTQKMIFLLAFTFFSLSVNSSNGPNGSLPGENCRPLMLLNKSTKSHLQLTDTQMQLIHEINHKYLAARRDILNTPDMIGQNTALLSCWDKWRRSLEEHLDEGQMTQFLDWQANVDLLAQKPF